MLCLKNGPGWLDSCFCRYVFSYKHFFKKTILSCKHHLKRHEPPPPFFHTGGNVSSKTLNTMYVFFLFFFKFPFLLWNCCCLINVQIELVDQLIWKMYNEPRFFFSNWVSALMFFPPSSGRVYPIFSVEDTQAAKCWHLLGNWKKHFTEGPACLKDR